MATAWDAYARELVGMGYGFPLWDPEPERHGEVHIGDVGFLVKGRFHRLFNPTLPAEHEVNQVWGVPDVFEELRIPSSLYSYKTTAISADTVCSKSFVKLDINANINAKSTVNLGLRFRCTNEQGAVLVLPTKKAIGEQLLPNSLIPKYMGRNHAYWYEFATERAQLDLKQEDIILISGWIKTARWAVAAFVEGGREVELSFGAGQASLADASFSVTTTQGVSRSWHQHSGPDTDEETTAGSSSVSRSVQDQCVFLHFYKSKRRLGGILPKLLPMKIAAAGEDGARRWPSGGNWDPPEDDDGASMILADSVSIDEVPQRTENYDPLEPILGHIVQTSNASVAVASTMDLPTVTGDEFSGYVQEWLNSNHPRVYVAGADGWQVGSLHNLDDEIAPSINDAAVIDDILLANIIREGASSSVINLRPEFARKQHSPESPEESSSANANDVSTYQLSKSSRKGGCWTCRMRKTKCDEQQETEGGPCQTCRRLGVECLGWGVKRPDWASDKNRVTAYRAQLGQTLRKTHTESRVLSPKGASPTPPPSVAAAASIAGSSTVTEQSTGERGEDVQGW
ncbi:uncharacterized protein C8Q71DRAFT_747171 [Rhodofomes roseus]|uniref:Zn(2)-C6 fungal-type domain-containing protein n=1 Tax=Rhodofomes roseus TaxID=34475 RepID=A0ABQ8KLD4_9APHY|nr:uncharacterized protein C8Q71DRAFT_747171 [Rhodofomes roseus]KAH9839021.1 hypothetical protein C8Q71DRAFT_747171 [Rhodofomes roseus]